MRRALAWLRRDLRLSDHRALFEACAAADEVVPVFIYDTTILNALADRDDRRVTFIHGSVNEIDQTLGVRGVATAVGDPVDLIPSLAARLDADAVFCAHDDDPYALRRDAAIASRVDLCTFKDHVIFERREIQNGSGEPYRVFAPYSRAWRSHLVPERDTASFDPDLARVIKRDQIPPEWRGNRTLNEIGFEPNPSLWKPGESAAQERLHRFRRQAANYPLRRDFPAAEATSSLGVDLRFGTISIRDCVRAALDGQADKWLDELIWREFYHMILACSPRVGEGLCFNSVYDRIRWPGSEDHFEAWCEGRTGFPLVDAAMRCFRETGWMHNRNRMVTASFLVKDLLVDWRRGEAWFARFLMDFDLASNNGNWQWAAGTGVDAQPYFRVFNPVTQSRKFDPDGAFIRQWCPELGDRGNKDIHEPVAPIVDHRAQAAKAVRLFEDACRGLG